MTQINRHLITRHSKNSDVQKCLQKEGDERLHQLELLKNLGNHEHNLRVMKKMSGLLKVRRAPKLGESSNPKDYLPCPMCFSWYLQHQLFAHEKVCHFGNGQKARDLKQRSEILLGEPLRKTQRMSKDDTEVIWKYFKKNIEDQKAPKKGEIFDFLAQLDQDSMIKEYSWTKIQEKVKYKINCSKKKSN